MKFEYVFIIFIDFFLCVENPTLSSRSESCFRCFSLACSNDPLSNRFNGSHTVSFSDCVKLVYHLGLVWVG